LTRRETFMLENQRTLYRFTLQYARLQMADIPEEKLSFQPAAGVNHPAWIMGHLAMAADFGAALLGHAKELSEAWYKQYGPGSNPVPDRAAYPAKAELMKAVAATHERLLVATANVTAELLAKPQTMIFQEYFPTIGVMLAHLMTTHPCVHLG